MDAEGGGSSGGGPDPAADGGADLDEPIDLEAELGRLLDTAMEEEAAASTASPPSGTPAQIIDDDDDEDAVAVEVEGAAAPAAQMASEEDDNSNCGICLDSLTEGSDPCALKCGHVYHTLCFQSWLLKSKGECPQCKTVSKMEELRVLSLEHGEVHNERLNEMIRLSTKSVAEQTAMARRAETERAELKEALDEAAGEGKGLREQMAADKRRRLESLKPMILAQDCAKADSGSLLRRHRADCATLLAERDSLATLQQRRLPIPQIQAGDPDYVDAVRRSRSFRESDQICCRQLHQGILQLRRQEQEHRGLTLERTKAAEETEEEVKKIRQNESRLRRQKGEMNLSRTMSSQSLHSVPSPSPSQPSDREPAASSAPSAAPADAAAVSREAGGTGDLLVASNSAKNSQSASASVSAVSSRVAAAGQGRAVTPGAARSQPGRAAEEEDDTDFIYGGAPARRVPSAGNLLARAGKTSLLSGRAVSGATAYEAPLKRPGALGGMRSLFAKQKA